MHYVLDTGFFIVIRDYYPDVFTTFWDEMDKAVQSGIISSVSEVKKEVEQYGGNQQHLLDWTNSHPDIFTKPNEQEQRNIREIFENKKSQRLIDKSKMLKGGPFADPFVIAKAMLSLKDVTVVTREIPAKRDKNNKIQGAPKIPDVCRDFDVSCMTPEGFMQQQKWQF